MCQSVGVTLVTSNFIFLACLALVKFKLLMQGADFYCCRVAPQTDKSANGHKRECFLIRASALVQFAVDSTPANLLHSAQLFVSDICSANKHDYKQKACHISVCDK